jgi:hypothetical protein
VKDSLERTLGDVEASARALGIGAIDINVIPQTKATRASGHATIAIAQPVNRA